ncbi:MAG: MmgE/PrpD family protein [Betaproteobacteria bacterium]|nr:MmgE/PrpD family protein [Betaproteobacteria bacterium]
MTDQHDIVDDFARVAACTRFEDLSAGAIDAAKKSVLDTLGVALAASGMAPAVRGLVDLVQETGGKPESTVLGSGVRVPAMMAALANGAMAHCLDFDDQTPWGQHAASSAVPTALALAERRGGVSGRRLIVAIAIAQDLFARLRCNVGWRHDWNLSSMAGVYSATAAGAHVLELDAGRTAHALGIASLHSCGTMETIFGVGTDLRGMYAGFTARGAVLAALLADRGITGIRTLFEGPAGIFNVYFGGRYDREGMLKDLGADFLGASTLYKYWPAVGNVHTYVHAVIELMKEQHLAPRDIEAIRVYVGDFHQRMCQPPAMRRAPRTLVDAKFSLPFCVAIAAAKGRMGVSDFTASGLEDPEVLAMAQRIEPIEDSRFDWKLELPSGVVDLVTRDGRRFTRVGDRVPGGPEAPLTWDQIARKFADCASCAARTIAPERIRKAQDFAHGLESLADATELVRTLAG